MEDLLMPGFAVAMGLITAVVTLFEVRRHRRLFRAAAKKCGLTDVLESGSYSETKLTGRSGERSVTLSTFADEKEARHTRIVVTGAQPILPRVSLHLEDGTPPASIEIEIGDPRFDATFLISGSPSRVMAALDAKTRRRLLRLAARLRPLGQLEVDCGAIAIEVDGAPGRNLVTTMTDALGALLDAVPDLPTTVDVPQQLASNARHDPEDGVRLSNLLVLVRELTANPLTREVLLEARTDRSAEVRLRAGRALGPEGVATLWQLVDGDGIPDSCVAGALGTLSSAVTFDRAKAALERALRLRHADTARWCLKAVAAHGTPAVATLAKVMTVERGELAVAAAQALGECRSDRVEAPLIAALDRGSEALRVAAAEALGRVGTVAAVLPLKESAERFVGDQDFRRAARQAIAEIQSRVGGASPGQLSMAGAEAGHLSIADPETGQVSLADAEAGRVSMTPDDPGD
jgi:hypothetical protein